jgi:hypothetical protein
MTPKAGMDGQSHREQRGRRYASALHPYPTWEKIPCGRDGVYCYRHRNALLPGLMATAGATGLFHCARVRRSPFALLLSIWAFYVFVPAAIGVLVSGSFFYPFMDVPCG